jgi:hypothetical protein
LLVRASSWKSIYDLEDSLTLEEMFLLYRASNNDFNMNAKAYAAAAGADVDWDEDWYEQSARSDSNTLRGSELPYLPIGLGYEAS